MSISMQMPAMPQVATLLRSPPSLALALQTGQVLDAKVIGPGPGNTMRVELQGQLLNLLLAQPAQPGATLKLKVEALTPQIRLSVQPPPAGGAPSPAVSQQPATTAPTLTVRAQPSPMTGVSPSIASSAPAPASPPTVAPTSGPAAPAAGQPTSVAAQSGATPSTVATSPAPGAAPAGTQVGRTEAPVITAGPAAAVRRDGVGLAGARVPAAPPAPTLAPLPNWPTAQASAAPPSSLPPLAATQPISSPQTHTTATTPQQALAQMVQAALPRQGAATALTATLTALVARTGVPEPVMKAAQHLLSSRMELGGTTLTGAALKQAVANSGVFSEARLAGATTMPAADGKLALMALRGALGKWLGTSQHPIAAAAPVPPPVRGTTPRARGPDPQPVNAVDPAASVEEIGRQALDRSEAAIARLRLHQHAGLPDADGRPAPAMTLDLPVVVGTHQALLHLQIRQEAESREGGSAERGWQMRFAINLPAMGEVGAQVSLRAGNVGVMLWATEEATAMALQAELELLRAGLVAAGLQPGSMLVRHGEPAAAPTSSQSPHLLDALR